MRIYEYTDYVVKLENGQFYENMDFSAHPAKVKCTAKQECAKKTESFHEADIFAKKYHGKVIKLDVSYNKSSVQYRS